MNMVKPLEKLKLELTSALYAGFGIGLSMVFNRYIPNFDIVTAGEIGGVAGYIVSYAGLTIANKLRDQPTTQAITT